MTSVERARRKEAALDRLLVLLDSHGPANAIMLTRDEQLVLSEPLPEVVAGLTFWLELEPNDRELRRMIRQVRSWL